MKIYTNENNTSTLKLLIASNLAGEKVEIVQTTVEAVPFPGPRQLPVLEVSDQLVLFSSNAATQYLLRGEGFLQNEKSFELLEWEATRLHPTVATVLTSKSVAPDLKQSLESLLQTVENLLEGRPFILGEQISAVDVSVFSTVYPLRHRDDLNKLYLSELKQINAWFERISAITAVQEVGRGWSWSGSAAGPSSALGVPPLPTLHSPDSRSPEGGLRPSSEEVSAARRGWLRGRDALPPPHTHQQPILPVAGRRNVLITSALPYVNNVPHLGNIIGCVLSADIFARYCRMCDYNTLFICGTDEYGTATETKALEEKVSPRELCDKYFAIHEEVYRWFHIKFDYFGRTTTDEQTQIAQKLFLKLNDNGFIAPQTENQLYCTKCERFLADRFVEGTCPQPGCLYESARGDQCDKCGKLVNAIELKSPRCKVCGASPEVRSSENLCMRLQALEPSLRSWIARSEQHWSAAARAVTRSWLKEPLRQRAITRDLKWGVKVPVKGYENKVFYVWFDAPIGYMSITQNATNDYEAWWKPDKQYDVTYYQFMAKDNVPFHVVMFPATLLGVNEGHLLVKHIYATEYLNYEEGKFSKSRGVGVFGTDARETEIPADVWRLYLSSVRPEGGDTSFSWSDLVTRNNSELLNNIGNFCHRSLTFCHSSFGGRVPDVQLTNDDYEFIALVNREVEGYVQCMERGKLRDALRHVTGAARLGNQHVQAQQPWLKLKGDHDDRVAASTAVGVCCQLVALLCALLAPYAPHTARRLRTQLNVDRAALRIDATNPAFIPYLPPGHVISKPEPLFTKIEPERVEELRAKYAGTQSERAEKSNGLGENVASLEKAIAEQGEKVRKLKASSKDKAAWQPEVDKLLQLKKQLVEAQKAAPPAAQSTDPQSTILQLERAVAAQGDKVRQLKASTADKAAWKPEVDKLLLLKKQLAEAQKAGEAHKKDGAAGGDSVASLEKQIAEQGDKVRKLKASTKDKSVWQPEVNVLLELKRRLAALQAH